MQNQALFFFFVCIAPFHLDHNHHHCHNIIVKNITHQLQSARETTLRDTQCLGKNRHQLLEESQVPQWVSCMCPSFSGQYISTSSPVSLCTICFVFVPHKSIQWSVSEDKIHLSTNTVKMLDILVLLIPLTFILSYLFHHFPSTAGPRTVKLSSLGER